MRWPFESWGADVVFAGHDHVYERSKVGVPYFVNGLGGDERYAFGAPRPDSVARYNAAQGAQLVEADASTMRLSFYDTRGVLLDSVTLPDTAVSARGQAWNDAANNYYTLSGAQSFTWRRIYIDTDNTTATGFQAGGVGGDYLIENRWLYRHRGGGWQWTPLTSLTLVATPDGLAWTVPRAAIGQTTSPNTDALSFEVEVPGFQNLGRTEHVYTVVAAAITDTSADNDDASVRYRAIFGSPFSYKHAFVDADTNPSTGFGYAGIGADYLVENTGLYRHVGPGWTWTRIGGVAAVGGATGPMVWTVPRALLGETAASGELADVVFHGSGGAPEFGTAALRHVYTATAP